MLDYGVRAEPAALWTEACNEGLDQRPADILETCLERIEVIPPYFALTNLAATETGLRAEIPVETPPLNETGLITAAEAGRHLAILGACASALVNPNPGRHYYLAYKAHFRREENQDYKGQATRLYGQAEARIVDKRTAESNAVLCNAEGAVVGRLNVHYHIVAEKAFAKIYKHHRQDTPVFWSDSPYRKSASVRDVRIDGADLTANIGTIQAEQCLGHFHEYPAMPVAIMMQTLIGAAGQMLHSLIHRPEAFGYLVTDAQVGAENLAFAGEHVDIRVKHLWSEGIFHGFHCSAHATEGKNVGDLVLTLKEDGGQGNLSV